MTKNMFHVLLVLLLFSCHKQTFEEKVSEDVKSFNHNEAPKRMDPVTVLDSLAFNRAKRTMMYFYTIEGVADNDTVLTEELRRRQRDALLENLRVSIQLRSYKEQKLNFEYRYYSSKSGRLLMRYKFGAEDYK